MGVSSTRVGDHRGSARTVQPLFNFTFIGFLFPEAGPNLPSGEMERIVLPCVFFLVVFLSCVFCICECVVLQILLFSVVFSLAFNICILEYIICF